MRMVENIDMAGLINFVQYCRHLCVMWQNPHLCVRVGLDSEMFRSLSNVFDEFAGYYA